MVLRSSTLSTNRRRSSLPQQAFRYIQSVLWQPTVPITTQQQQQQQRQRQRRHCHTIISIASSCKRPWYYQQTLLASTSFHHSSYSSTSMRFDLTSPPFSSLDENHNLNDHQTQNIDEQVIEIQQHPEESTFSASLDLGELDAPVLIEENATTPSSVDKSVAKSNEGNKELSILSSSSSASASSLSSKGSPSLSPPQLLNLRQLHPRDTIEKHFDKLALRTELSKLRFVGILRDKIHRAVIAAAQKKNGKDGENSIVWKTTETFFESRKALPAYVKTAFWNLIVAPSTDNEDSNTNSNSNSNSDGNSKELKRKLKKGKGGTQQRNPKKKISTPWPSLDVSKSCIEVLLEVRNRAVERPIFWSHAHKHQTLQRYLEETKEETNDTTVLPRTQMKRTKKEMLPEYQAKRSQILKARHFDLKSEEVRYREATEMTKFLRAHLPPAYYEKLISALKLYADESPKSRITDVYFKAVQSCVHANAYQIADEFFSYLYLIDNFDQEKENLNENLETDNEEKKILAMDPALNRHKDKWMSEREKFCENFEAIQSLLFEEHEAKRRDWQKHQAEQLNNESHMNNLERDSDVEVPYNTSEESVMATFEEASIRPKTRSEEPKIKIKPRSYIAFEAITIGDFSGSTSPEDAPMTSDVYAFESTRTQDTNVVEEKKALYAPISSNHCVFVDNLPIDIDKEKLHQAYSRCGPIDRIDLFNLRPELDPGRKSEDNKKKIRKPVSGGNRRGWERPRTPVYASILYKEEKGAAKACVDPLRIFGMVLDKHLMRSHKASDMTTLYIEDIPPQYDISSIEYNLSQLLHPSLYVCLDVENGRQKRQRSSQNSSLNCVIQFSNFESAHWAYRKLIVEKDDQADGMQAEEENVEDEFEMPENDDSVSMLAGDASIHWLPTPKDSMLYWTRNLNF